MLIDGYEYTLEPTATPATLLTIVNPDSGESIVRGFDTRATARYQDKEGFFSLDRFIDFVREVVALSTYAYFERGN